MGSPTVSSPPRGEVLTARRALRGGEPDLLQRWEGADNVDVSRKGLVIVAQALIAVAALGLTALSMAEGPLPLIYGCLLLTGIGRAFYLPARWALIAARRDWPQLASWTGGPIVLGSPRDGLVEPSELDRMPYEPIAPCQAELATVLLTHRSACDDAAEPC